MLSPTILRSPKRTGRRGSERYRPGVELLEDRRVPATIVVTGAGDTIAIDGLVTLREAITAANTNAVSGDAPAGDAGLDTINFNISGAGVHTISPTSDLPTITQPLIIDGYTQPGASPNANALALGSGALGSNAVLLIELDGSQIAGGGTGLNITAGSSTVRGMVINRCANFGIILSTGAGNIIEGNFVGTDPGGTVGFANGSGIFIASANNLIGGSTAAARNVLSGNTTNQISVGGTSAVTGNVIQGNFIGTTFAGTAAVTISNPPTGIRMIGGAGGLTVADNLISGNRHGIDFQNGAGNFIQGNFIGTNLTGTVILSNTFSGITSNAGTTLIGGTTAAARNIISGNLSGISLDGTDNTVQGNYIGTDVTGMVDLGNTSTGITLIGSNNTIGGTAAGTGNVISGNTIQGIAFNSGTGGHVVQGNLIGVAADGVTPLGNGTEGMIVSTDNNSIGGLAAGAGNIIAFNSGAGVTVGASNNAIVGNTIFSNGGDGVFVSSGTGNSVSSNAIHSNTGLGIDLSPNGMTANDLDDPDPGANNKQNYPVLTSVTSSGGNTTIIGTLNSVASIAFTLEFFVNDAADATGFGEGQNFLYSAPVTTDAGGDFSFSFTFPGTVLQGQFVSATATDPSNNTSEFSLAVPLSAPIADISPTSLNFGNQSVGSSSVPQTITVTNSGNAPLIITSIVVDSTEYSFTTDCNLPATLAPSESCTIDVTFAPTSIGLTLGQVTITDNAADSPQTVSLTGVGTVAPTVDAGPDGNGAEGSSFTPPGSFSDPDSTSWTATVNYDDGGGDQPLSLNPDKTFSFNHLYADNGNYTVTVQVTDDLGNTGSDTMTVIVANIAPTPGVSGPTDGVSGQMLTFTLTAVDPSSVDQAAGFTFNIDWDGDGFVDQTVVGPSGTTVDHSYAAPATYTVRMTATDKDSGISTEANQAVTIHSTVPTVDAGPDGNLDEGGTFSSSGSFTDPDLDTWTAIVNYGDGTGDQSLTLNPGKTFNLSHDYADNGTFTVTVTVTDNHGDSGNDAATVIVANVAPTASIAGPTNGVPGQPLNFTLGATDPSPDDQAAGFTFAIDWDGDGTVDETVSGLNGLQFDHAFDTIGSFTIQVTAMDDDGGVSTAVNQDVTITTTSMQIDPCDPGLTALYFGGTSGNDVIKLKPGTTPGTMLLSFNAVTLGSFSPTGRIIFFGQAGNDKLKASKKVTLPLWLHGGAGNDKLKGGAAADILWGDGGIDKLTGNGGADVLIGGTGADKLKGGFGSDLLVGGSTVFDATAAAHCPIFDEWISTRTADTLNNYQNRTSNLLGSANPDFANRLNADFFLQAGVTIVDDAALDVIKGSQDLDWFFASTGATPDRAADVAIGELVQG